MENPVIENYGVLGSCKMHIGERLRKARKSCNLTAGELSKLSGVAEKTIYRIETGEVKDPRISSVKPLIRELNISADEIIFDANEFTVLKELNQALMRASCLREDDMNMIITIINKVSLASNIECEVGEALKRLNDSDQ